MLKDTAGFVLDRLEQHPLDEAAQVELLGLIEADAPDDTEQSAPSIDGLYLRSIAVEGFRGIGPEVTLSLTPGPGLTVVAGRNGSGKSSFADAMELLLKGSVHRFDRATLFKAGWRNAHVDGSGSLTAELQPANDPDPLRLTTSWTAESEVSDCRVVALLTGDDLCSPHEAGLGSEARTHAPLLNLGEVEDLLDKPSTFYDRIDEVLDLDEFTEINETLGASRRELDKAKRELDKTRKQLADELAEFDDERAHELGALLKARTPVVDDIRTNVAGLVHGGDDVETLRRWAAVEVPEDAELTAVVDTLAAAKAAADAIVGTDAAAADLLVSLLEAALQHHAQTDGETCPVCSTGMLNEAWRTATEQGINRLRAEAQGARDTKTRLDGALSESRRLVTMPSDATVLKELALDPSTVMSFSEMATIALADPIDAEAFASAAAGYCAALDEIRAEAKELLAQRNAEWTPVLGRVTSVCDQLDELGDAAGRIKALKSAEAWMGEALDEARHQRLEPIRRECQRIWERLRQGSNVDIGEMVMSGAKTRRKVEVGVEVDGTAVDGLGVLSQGEINSFALSVFLPRATVEQSPFRFLLIDDPVQALDPAKVAGLAQVLAEVAATRQVVVFTHDERLPDAIRRLDIDARIHEVTRRPGSVVSIRPSGDPGSRLLADAKAIASDKGTPPEVRRRVIPGLCRQALDISASTAARHRMLSAGHSVDEVDETLSNLKGTNSGLALALFGDAQQGADVLSELNRKLGRPVADSYQAIRKGAHEAVDRDPFGLIKDTSKIVDLLEELR